MPYQLQLLTTRELAAQLKRAPETLVRWRRLRKGPPFRRVQGHVLYDLTEIQQWLGSSPDTGSVSVSGEASTVTSCRSGSTR